MSPDGLLLSEVLILTMVVLFVIIPIWGLRRVWRHRSELSLLAILLWVALTVMPFGAILTLLLFPRYISIVNGDI